MEDITEVVKLTPQEGAKIDDAGRSTGSAL